MISAALLWNFFVLSPAFAFSDDTCRNPQPRSCAFYIECLEQARPCGPTGYAQAYGFPYCDEFDRLDDSLSESGRHWRNATLSCLQKALVPLLDLDQEVLSCGDIERVAFNTHPDCYTQPEASICFLSNGDITTIFSRLEAGDIFNRKGRKQISDVIGICISQLTRKTRHSSSRKLLSFLTGEKSDEHESLKSKLSIFETLARKPVAITEGEDDPTFRPKKDNGNHGAAKTSL